MYIPGDASGYLFLTKKKTKNKYITILDTNNNTLITTNLLFDKKKLLETLGFGSGGAKMTQARGGT